MQTATANVELLLSCTRMPKFLFLPRRKDTIDNVSVIADVRAKTCTHMVDFVASTITVVLVHGVFMTNAYKEYMFCD